MPATTPSCVTLHDGDTMTASDWRRLTEPVHGYNEIGKSDLGGRRVRIIEHAGTKQWVVTADTALNSWAYIIKPELAAPTCDDTDADRAARAHPPEVYWAFTVAATGYDSRIQPSAPYQRFDLGGGDMLFITRHETQWVVVLWHGYLLNFRYRNDRVNEHYVSFVAGDFAGECLTALRQRLDDVPHSARRAGLDIATKSWEKMWRDIDDVVFAPE